MTLEPADINLFLTGGSSNTNPQTSLGGNVSSQKVNSDILNNLFRRITDSEASSGITLYRCLAVKNTDTTDEARNVTVYMVYDTKSNDSLALYSKAQAGRNTVETPIVDEFTPPTGSNINFIAALNRSGGINLGDLDINEYRCMWLRYTVQPGATPFPNDEFKIRIEVDTTGSPPPPVPEPDPETGVNFQMAAVADLGAGSTFSGIFSKIKNRGADYALFPGDLGYTDASGWKDIIGSWNKKSAIAFGNHDVDSSSKKNTYMNMYSISKTYNKWIFKNVGIISMEAGEDQSTSSGSGSAQYNQVKNWLGELKGDSGIEWIFVINHYPLYGPDSHHPNEDSVRDDYDPLFDEFGVDAVFTGHNHNIWHSKLLKYDSGSPESPNTAGTDPNYSYRKSAANHGKLYFGVGGGGQKDLYDINSVPSYVTYSNDSTFGYLFMDFSNDGKKITFKFYNKSDSLLNTCTLTHT